MPKFKKTLVTGGSGFLGKKVVARLQSLSYDNISIPRKKDYDLTEQSQVRQLLKDVQPDLVIHMAATVGGIGANRENPGRFFYENLLMGTSLMEESRRIGVEKFVAIGTICAYPKFAPTPFKEEDLWSGYPEETNAPYGLAKKMLLVQSQAYRDQYGFNAIYLLPVNLYGPEDNLDLKSSHVMPAIIRKCWQAKQEQAPQIVLWGDGSPTREFLYVEDAARAIVMAAEQYDKPEPVNIGSGKEISIKDLAHLITKAFDYTGEIIWDTSKPNGQPRRLLDISRAKREFGFVAEITMEEGLRTTIDWYKKKLAQLPQGVF